MRRRQAAGLPVNEGFERRVVRIQAGQVEFAGIRRGAGGTRQRDMRRARRFGHLAVTRTALCTHCRSRFDAFAQDRGDLVEVAENPVEFRAAANYRGHHRHVVFGQSATFRAAPATGRSIDGRLAPFPTATTFETLAEKGLVHLDDTLQAVAYARR